MAGCACDHLLPRPTPGRIHRGDAITLPPLDLQALLRHHRIDPRKSLGQNFLVSDDALRLVVACAEINSSDAVLEIGAGAGSLTRLLAATAARVSAVEIDRKLIPVLREVLSAFRNVDIIQGDILELDPGKMVSQDYIAVANIPYYITSAIIRHLLENPVKPSRLVLTIQKEVAERICAEAGDLSLLALSVQVYGRPFIAAEIPASAFYPVPKVDSATLRVDIYPRPLLNDQQRMLFFAVARMGFAQKRKMLRNTLAAGLRVSTDTASGLLLAAGIDPTRRAQTLDLVEWRTLLGEIENQLDLTKIVES